MTNKRQIKLTIVLTFCVLNILYSQPVASIYYISVGSIHYNNNFDEYAPGFNGLLNLEAAGISATKIETLLKGFGALGGEVVLSSPNDFIDSLKIFNALTELIKKVKSENKPNPFIIFYYAGHGFSGPEVEAIFLPPGNFVENPDSLDMKGWQKHAISPLEIQELLEYNEVNHMIMLDCCYEGRQQPDKLLDKSVVKSLGLEQFESLMLDMNDIFRAMFRMVGPNPVVFSAPVDKSVKTVPLPNDSSLYVGPLCRRAYIIQNKLKDDKISLKLFISLLTSMELDTITIPAVTHVSFDNTGEWLIKQ